MERNYQNLNDNSPWKIKKKQIAKAQVNIEQKPNNKYTWKLKFDH